MNIIIIEDERLTALDLEQTIKTVDSSVEIVQVLRSVKEGQQYFSQHRSPDLIFSDIKLGDGLSFEILEPLKTPVVFCTAYDEYALNAFGANGIDYILKPFTQASVSKALQKYKELKGENESTLLQQYKALKEIFNHSPLQKTSSLLIRYRDIIIPVRFEDIALFYLDKNIVKAITFKGENYFPNKNLDDLEQIAGSDFFRANRQYIVNRKSVAHVSSILSRKLSISVTVPHKDSILISREKVPFFLKWLSGDTDTI